MSNIRQNTLNPSQDVLELITEEVDTVTDVRLLEDTATGETGNEELAVKA